MSLRLTRILLLMLIVVLPLQCASHNPYAITGKQSDQPRIADANSFEMEPLRVVLSHRKTHTVTIAITLKYNGDPRLSDELKNKSDDIRSAIGKLVAEKKFEELDSVDDYNRLHREIKQAVNAILKSGSIADVFFRDFEAR